MSIDWMVPLSSTVLGCMCGNRVDHARSRVKKDNETDSASLHLIILAFFITVAVV